MDNNQMHSIGGYLPIHIDLGSNELYREDVIRLNAARNAILLAMSDGGFERVLLPIYTCESVKNTLLKYGYEVNYYNIGYDFSPALSEKQIRDVNDNTAIVIVNYFGVYCASHDLSMFKRKNVIIDNTQCFYEPPVLDAYNVYSCRKFFGVSDGAYLIKKGLKNYDLEQDFSSERAWYLLKSLEKGTNSVYDEYLNAEREIDNSPILRMSPLTDAIMKSIHYSEINRKRLENFQILHEGLQEINELSFELPSKSPMIYPLLVIDNNLRQELIKNKIYIPQWWKWVVESAYSNEFERKLSKYLLPLPIDQRYSQDDMKYVINVIYDVVHGRAKNNV